jgi:hypothetical protein
MPSTGEMRGLERRREKREERREKREERREKRREKGLLVSIPESRALKIHGPCTSCQHTSQTINIKS